MKAPQQLVVVVFLGLGWAAAPAHAQPKDLVGFRLGQAINEVKKEQGSKVKLVQRGRVDQTLRACGLETYAIEHGEERLEISSLHGKIVKLDLSKDLDEMDPIAMAKNFVAAYGPPRKTACKREGGEVEVHTLPSQCGADQTFVELAYWWGESDLQKVVVLRVRLRRETEDFPLPHSRVTLSRGWDAQVEKLEACGEKVGRDLKISESEGARTAKPIVLIGPSHVWSDPSDGGWLQVFSLTFIE